MTASGVSDPSAAPSKTLALAQVDPVLTFPGHALGLSPHAVLAHHLDQHAFAQAAIGDAQARAREGAANGVEDGAAGEHQVGALAADAGIGSAFVEAHVYELPDHARNLVVGEPAAVDAPAVVSLEVEKHAGNRGH